MREIKKKELLADILCSFSRMAQWVVFFALVVFVAGREDFGLTKMLCTVIGATTVSFLLKFFAYMLDPEVEDEDIFLFK